MNATEKLTADEGPLSPEEEARWRARDAVMYAPWNLPNRMWATIDAERAKVEALKAEAWTLRNVALTADDRATAAEAEAERMRAALKLALPRLAHKASCHSVRPVSEWPEHGSASFGNCNCEIKAVEAALAKKEKPDAAE